MKNIKLIFRKNILDNDFNKYLQISSTSVIILFTYIIAIFIAWVTDKIDFYDIKYLSILLLVTITVLCIFGFFLINSIIKMRRIKRALVKIEKSIQKI